VRVNSAEEAAQVLQQVRGWVVLYVERNGRVGSVQFSIGG
jgi:hypothetical protein